jgi:hypothetical protein
MKQAVRRKVAPPRSKVRTWTCERDGQTVTDRYCPSCELYNAAVHAQQEAARYIATSKVSAAAGAWLNEYGVFAWVDGKTVQLGSKEEAAPFAALTGATIRVKTFCARPTRSKTNDAGDAAR